jgi:hypothetical protein
VGEKGGRPKGGLGDEVSHCVARRNNSDDSFVENKLILIVGGVKCDPAILWDGEMCEG